MINLPPPPGYKPTKKSKGVFRKPTQEERALIASFISKHSVYAAGLEFNISSTLTRSISKQFGIAPKKRGRSRVYTKDDIAQWAAYMKINPRITHCAVNFNVSPTTIKLYLDELAVN